MSLAEAVADARDRFLDGLDTARERHPLLVLALLLLALALLAGAAWWLASAFLAPPQAGEAGLRFVGPDGEPLKGLQVRVQNNFVTRTLVTDENGVVALTVPFSPLHSVVSVENEAWAFEGSVALRAGHTETLTALPVDAGGSLPDQNGGVASLQPRVVELFVVDRETRAQVTGPVTLSFLCEEGQAPPDEVVDGASQPFRLETPPDCQGFAVQAQAEGYAPSPTRRLLRDTEFLFLEPSLPPAPSTGALEVRVASADGNPAAGAVVLVLDPPSVVVAQAETDEAGAAWFEALPAGRYWVSASAGEGESALAKAVAVAAGEAARVELALSAPAAGTPEEPEQGIRFRVLDAVTRAPVEGAQAWLYVDGTPFGAPVVSDENGEGLVRVAPWQAARPLLLKLVHAAYLEGVFSVTARALDAPAQELALAPLPLPPPQDANADANALPSPSPAPEANASVEVHVLDASGLPAAGVAARLLDSWGFAVSEAVTGPDGSAALTAPAGDYLLAAWTPQDALFYEETLSLSAGARAVRSLRLPPPPGQEPADGNAGDGNASSPSPVPLAVAVVDAATGAPVAGAQVTAWKNALPLAGAETGSDGRALLALPPLAASGAVITVLARANGYLPGQQETAAREGAFASLVLELSPLQAPPTPEPERGGLDIEVVDGQGQGWSGARVTVFAEGGEEAASALTDASGRAGFDGLAPGVYAVRALTAQDTGAVLAGVPVRAGQRTPVRLRVPRPTSLARARLAVRALDAATRAPVEGAQASFFADGVLVGVAETAEDGTASLELAGAWEGTAFSVLLAHPRYLLQEAAVSLQEEGEAPVEVLMAQKPASCGALCGALSVEVRTPEGAPVEGAVLSLFLEREGSWAQVAFAEPPRTGADGARALEQLRAGVYRVTAEKDGVRASSAAFQVPGGGRAVVQLVLEPARPQAAAVLVQVLDHEGTGVEGVPVALFAADSATPLARAVTDAVGHAFFGSLAPGVYVARARWKERVLASDPVQAPAGGAAEARITLPEPARSGPACAAPCGELEVLVVDGRGRALAGAEVRVFYAGTRLPWGPPGTRFFTGADGTALLRPLPAGAFFAVAVAGALEGESPAVEVEDGERAQARVVALPVTGWLRVRVEDAETGQPLDGARVALEGAGGEALGACETGSQGVCETPPLAAGTRVTVHVQREGYEDAWSGGERGGFVVPARQASEVTVRVLRRLSDQPLAVALEQACLDPACQRPVAELASDPAQARSYWLVFRLEVSEPRLEQAVFQFVAGESAPGHIPLEGYGWRVEDAAGAGADHVFFSQCAQEEPFAQGDAACQAIDPPRHARQALVYWNALEKGAYTVRVRVEVEPGWGGGEGARLEGVARARAVAGTRPVASGDEAVAFTAGVPFCGQKTLHWSFWLEDEDGARRALEPDSAAHTLLRQDTVYRLGYRVVNCLRQPLAGVEVVLANEDDPPRLSFSEEDRVPGPVKLTRAPVALGAGRALEEGSPVPLRGTAPAAVTRAVFRLTQHGALAGEGARAVLAFGVEGKNQLYVEGLAGSHAAVDEVVLEGVVRDALSHEPVPRARVSLHWNTLEAWQGWSGPDGAFSLDAFLPRALSPEDALTVVVEKPGYARLERQVRVRPPREEAPAPYECVERVWPPSRQGMRVPSVERGRALRFGLENACPVPLQVRVATDLGARPARFSLAAGERGGFDLVAGPRSPLGYHAVTVLARRQDDDTERVLFLSGVAVTDEDACFSINRVVFDLRDGADQAVVTNRCWTAQGLAAFPVFSLSAAPRVALEAPAARPDTVSLQARVFSSAVLQRLGGGKEAIEQLHLQRASSFPVQGPESVLFFLDPRQLFYGSGDGNVAGLLEERDAAGVLVWDLNTRAGAERVQGAAGARLFYDGERVLARPLAGARDEGLYGVVLRDRGLAVTQQAVLTVTDAAHPPPPR